MKPIDHRYRPAASTGLPGSTKRKRAQLFEAALHSAAQAEHDQPRTRRGLPPPLQTAQVKPNAPDWKVEYLDIMSTYPSAHLDPERPDPGVSDIESCWRVILETRQKVFKRSQIAGSLDTISAKEKTETQNFALALCETWDSAFMRGRWKERIVDSIDRAFDADLDVLGTSEWDPELNELVRSRGLAVSSSSRLIGGRECDGNAVIYDPKVYELLESSKLAFQSTLSSSEKIAHLALLRHRETGDLLFVQSAHLEKSPQDQKRNDIRLEQVRELSLSALEAQRRGATVLLLSDTNTQTMFGDTPNPVDQALAQTYSHLHRPTAPTAVTAQRSMSIDVVASTPLEGAFVGGGSAGRLEKVKAALGPLMPGVDSEVLPSAQNPSDHTWVVDAVPTPGGGVVAGTWNVLSKRYRNPLKGNLFYPLVFLFDRENPSDERALKTVKRTWGSFYTASKYIPGWQKDGVPNEKAFLGEYLIGPQLTQLNDIRQAVNTIIESWTDEERHEFEKARARQPELLSSHPAYKYNAEAVYLLTQKREALKAALREHRSVP